MHDILVGEGDLRCVVSPKSEDTIVGFGPRGKGLGGPRHEMEEQLGVICIDVSTMLFRSLARSRIEAVAMTSGTITALVVTGSFWTAITRTVTMDWPGR